MNSMILMVLTNSIIAAFLFLFVLVCQPRVKNQALLHCLWLLVLLKLLTPSLWTPRWELLPAEYSATEVGPAPVTATGRQEQVRADVIPAESVPSVVTRQADSTVPPQRDVHALRTNGQTPSEVTRQFRPPGLSWQSVLVLAWALGACCWWGLSAWRIICLERCLRFAKADAEIQATVWALGSSLGLRRVPRVLQVPGCVSPMLWSFCGATRIVVPQELFKELDEPSRNTLLLHELVHYRRGDHWVRWLELAALGLYWWNPIAWLLRRQIHVAEELACDACVVSHRPDDRRAYAEMLVSTIAFLSSAQVPVLATGVGNTRHLEERLKTIMRSAKEARISVRMRVVVSLAAVLLLPLAPVLVPAQRPAEKVTEAPATPDLPGTVVDETGQPVAGIEVKAFLNARPLKEPLKTNAAGQFTIPGSWRSQDRFDSQAVLVVRQGTSHVGWLDLKGLLWSDPKKPHPAIVKDGIRIVLTAQSRIVRGTLVDMKGSPLPGIRLAVDGITHPQNQGINGYEVGDDQLPAATTNQEGIFELRLPENATAGLEPQHPDWQRRRIMIKSNTSDLGRITLQPAGRIQGQVVDAASGRPLAGQAVFAQTEGRPAGDSEFVGYGSAKTDQEGRYVIGGLSPGNFNVMFSGTLAPGLDHQGPLTAAAVEGVDVQAGKPAVADVNAITGRFIRGKVVDGSTGAPLSKIHVGYYGVARPKSTAACIMVRTKADGTFEFRVPPGVSRVYVAEGGRGPHADSDRTLEVPADRDLVDVILKAGEKNNGSYGEAVATESETETTSAATPAPKPYRLHVRLIPPSGKKVNAVEARVIEKGNEHTSSWVDLPGTDYEVTFIPREAGRRMFLLIDANGFAAVRSREFVVAAQMPELSVELQPEVLVPVRGRLVDTNGGPVAEARVRVERAIYGTEKKFPWGQEYQTGNDGRFEIKHARQGDKIQLHVDKPGTGGAESAWLTLDTPEARVLPDLQLSGFDHEVGGIIRDSDGLPVANVKIMGTEEPRAETTSDKEGKFLLSGLPLGDIPVALVMEGFPRQSRTLRAGRFDYRIHFDRTRQQDRDDYQLDVTLRPSDQKEVSLVTIYACAENGRLLFWQPDRKGNSQRVGFDDLVRRFPGHKLELHVAAQGYAWSAPISIPVEKKPKGIVIDLKAAAPATIRGRVVDEAGQPVANARVGLSTIFSKTAEYKPWQYLDEQSKLPVTDADGKFELTGIQPNCQVSLYINKVGYAGVTSSQLAVDKSGAIDLPDLRLSKATGELSGRVVDQEGKPVADAFVTIHDITPLEATTDKQGRFQMQGVPNKELSINVRSEVGGWYKRLTLDGKELEIKVSKQYPGD